MEYSEFLERKTHLKNEYGFSPVFMPDKLFDFQKSLVEWATLKGRSAIFADCGLGKTFMQLTWAQNVAQHTNGRVLILTPLAVSPQTVDEGVKIGVDVKHRKEGIKSSDDIVVTNYERLHYFNPNDFQGIVCDESSILKNFAGKTTDAIIEFSKHIPYRQLDTATAAPNDHIELGTSSEALGVMRRPEMLGMFFVHDSGDTGEWRIKKHAQDVFWRWVCSWARAIRKPSDLGFCDDGFILSELKIRQHIVQAKSLPNGYLFEVPAVGLDEQRDELRRTKTERCEMVAELVNNTGKPFLCWCNLNIEGDLMERLIPDAVQVSGADSDDRKEEVFKAYSKGLIRGIITKCSIGGFGMNWQHNAHETYFPSHSYEQFYQGVRRCWRFGQKNPVTVDIVTTEGQQRVIDNMTAKMEQTDLMFAQLVRLMSTELQKQAITKNTTKEIVPSWL